MNPIERKIYEMILSGGGTYQGIRIPKPQRHGTITQCVTYAKITAEQIYNKNKDYFHLLLE